VTGDASDADENQPFRLGVNFPGGRVNFHLSRLRPKKNFSHALNTRGPRVRT